MVTDADVCADVLEGRRSFLGAGLGMAGAAAVGSVLAACSTGSSAQPADQSAPDTIPFDGGGAPDIEWTMATSWPTSLVTLYGAAELFSDELFKITDGKFKIDVKPAGEIVGGTEVLQGFAMVAPSRVIQVRTITPV